jgi:predicted S18 family serine protease
MGAPMGMAQLAETVTDRGEAHAALRLVRKPSRIEEALRLAIVQASGETRTTADLEDETSSAIAHIRDASAFRRSAEKRINDLEAELDDVRASAVRDIHSAEDRAEHAEARLALEIERATSAERRLKLAEERLEQVMAVIETELNPRAKQG